MNFWNSHEKFFSFFLLVLCVCVYVKIKFKLAWLLMFRSPYADIRINFELYEHVRSLIKFIFDCYYKCLLCCGACVSLPVWLCVCMSHVSVCMHVCTLHNASNYCYCCCGCFIRPMTMPYFDLLQWTWAKVIWNRSQFFSPLKQLCINKYTHT